MKKPFKTLLALWLGILVVTTALFWAFEKYGNRWAEAVVARSPHYHFERGLDAMNSGNPAEAEEHLRRAIDLEPRNSGYWRHLGLALSAQGEYTEAIPCFEKAIDTLGDYLKSRPQYDRGELLSRYRMDLARQYEHLGKYGDAIVNAEDALVLAPTPELKADQLATLCRILHAGKSWEKLAKRSLEGLEIRPGDALYSYYRARSLLETGGDLEEAQRRINTACQTDGAQGLYFQTQARIREALGDSAGALDSLRGAVAREKENPDVLVTAWHAAMAAGETEEASGYLEALKALADHVPGAQSAFDSIQKSQMTSGGIESATSAETVPSATGTDGTQKSP